MEEGSSEGLGVAVPRPTSSCIPHSSSIVTQASMGKAISRPLMVRCSSRGFPKEGFSTQASEGTQQERYQGRSLTQEIFLSFSHTDSPKTTNDMEAPVSLHLCSFVNDGEDWAGWVAHQLCAEVLGFM